MGAEWGVLPCNRLLPAAHYTELPRPRPPTGHVGEGGGGGEEGGGGGVYTVGAHSVTDKNAVVDMTTLKCLL